MKRNFLWISPTTVINKFPSLDKCITLNFELWKNTLYSNVTKLKMQKKACEQKEKRKKISFIKTFVLKPNVERNWMRSAQNFKFQTVTMFNLIYYLEFSEMKNDGKHWRFFPLMFVHLTALHPHSLRIKRKKRIIIFFFTRLNSYLNDNFWPSKFVDRIWFELDILYRDRERRCVCVCVSVYRRWDEMVILIS